MVALYELMDLFPDTFKPELRPKLNDLFQFLKTSEKMKEARAATLFLNGKKKQFNKLKNELKEVLCSHVITNPSTWVSNDQKALYNNSYQLFAAYKILLGSGRREVAIERAKLLLPKLCQLEIHGLIYMVALDLQYHYFGIDIIPRLARRYADIVEQQMEYLNAEAIVRRSHAEVSFISNTKNNFSPLVIKRLEELVQTSIPYLSLQSNTLNRLIYNIIIVRYSAAYDYQQVLYYCEKALNSFDKKYPIYNALRFDFLQKKIPALVATKQLNTAKEIAKEIGQMMPAGKFNWHVALIRRVIICLHSGDYQEAYDLFKAQTKQRSTYRILKEYWKLIEGFLYFLIITGHIENYNKERFSLGKFLNEVPLYSKDKAGNNINILIIQIIIQIHRGEYGKIIDRIDSLREYARAHTRNPETKRANIFINMILKMEAASFHRIGTERRTRNLLKKLNNTPLSLGQNLGIEIIPYPILWQEILTILDNKFRTTIIRKQTPSNKK